MSESKLIEVPFYDDETKMERIAVIEKEPILKLILQISAFSSVLLEEYKISPDEKEKYYLLCSVYNLERIKELPNDDNRNVKLYHFFKLELIDSQKKIIRECSKEVGTTRYLLEMIEFADVETFTKITMSNKGSCDCDDYETHSNSSKKDGINIALWNQKFLGGVVQYTNYDLIFEIYRVIGNMFPFCIAKAYRFHNKKGVCTTSLVAYNEVLMFLNEINDSGLKHEYRILDDKAVSEE